MSNWKAIIDAIQTSQQYGEGNVYDGNIAGAIRAFEELPPSDPTSYDQNWRGFIEAAIAAGCSTNGSSDSSIYDDSIAGAIRMFQNLTPGDQSLYDYNMAGLLLAIQNATCETGPPPEFELGYQFQYPENSMYFHLVF